MENNLKLQGCPSDLQDKVKEMVTEYWDGFLKDELCRPIELFSFHFDTGNHPHICFKPPRYGPHESDVMWKLVDRLDENGVVEEDDVSWGSLVVLTEKPRQENVPWN